MLHCRFRIPPFTEPFEQVSMKPIPFKLHALILGLFGAACAATGHSDLGEEHMALIPKPNELRVHAGHYQASPSDAVWMEGEALFAMELDRRILEVLDPDGVRPSGLGVNTGSQGASRIVLTLEEESPQLGSEGYRLSVTPEQIHISAPSPVGVFYGVQTLKQLIPRGEGAKAKVPCCEIVDSPRFAWRGQLLDVSRHFLPLDFVRKNIDYLAALKLNVFHWHLTDDQGWRVPIEAYPKLTTVGAWRTDRNDEPWWGRAEQSAGEETTYGGFYTREEIAETIEYARLRGVTIVPEIDMPGHSRAAIAAYPEISCDGIQRHVATGGIADTNTFCPGKEVTFEFAQQVLDSVIDLFPSEYIHIGGDECNKRAWIACPDCQTRMAEEGLKSPEELQSYFIQRIEKMVNARGRKMIGWDEILEGGLAPNAVVMSWRGEAGGIAAAQAGHEVVMTPNSHCYLDLKQGDPETEPELGYSQLLLSTAYSYEPIPKELSEEEAHRILGIQGNLWGESIQGEREANYMLFPRLFAIAEVAWTQPEHRGWGDFMGRLEPQFGRLSARGIGYAPSLYQVKIGVRDGSAKDGVRVTLSTEHGGVRIRYTLDGSEPTRRSPLYAEPLVFTETATICATAFRDGKALGRVSRRTLALHKAIGKPVQSPSVWSEKYHGGGSAGLTDGKRATVLHTDDRWIGYQGSDLTATIDLGEETSIRQVALGCLEAQNSWIFYPKSLEVQLSTDGEHFESAGSVEYETTARTEVERRRDFVIDTGDRTARFVRVQVDSMMHCPEWHRGAGGKAWLFVDEIVVH